MFVKIHRSYRDIVAICDSEILGEKFEEDKFQIEVKESFFGNKKYSKEEVREIIQNRNKEDAIFNIVGEKSVNLALEENLISKESIKRIQKVPFTMVLL